MKTIILLMRHGETEWNRAQRFRGTYDIALNENGRHQAGLLAHALQGRKINAAYTSPLSRARETAALALAGRAISPVECPGLIDIDYGEWTGLEDTEVAKQWPTEYDTWCQRPDEARIPSGETLEKVADRGFAAMEEIASRHEGETIALFAHRVINKVLVLRALGCELCRFPFIVQGNCCINEFERNSSGYVIRGLNDTSHVRGDGKPLLDTDF